MRSGPPTPAGLCGWPASRRPGGRVWGGGGGAGGWGGAVDKAPAGLTPGQNFHAPGADLRPGEHVLPAGVQLGAAELGLAAALGLPELLVGRRPRVALMSTGDELVEGGKTPGRGQIPDSNRWALLASLPEAGAEVRLLGIGPDEPEALRRLVPHPPPGAAVLLPPTRPPLRPPTPHQPPPS